MASALARSNEAELGRVDAFPVGRFRVVTVGSLEVGVLRHPDGSVYALRNRCPHKGAPLCLGSVGGTMLPSAPGALNYGMDAMVVRCPWHGYEFDVATGRAVFANTDLRARSYPVTVRDGIAFLTLRRQGDTT